MPSRSVHFFVVIMSHNLNIDTYSIEDVYSLFDMQIDRSTPNELKQAKRKMQNTHPDKSKLDSAYYLFYQSAYAVLESHFNSCNAVHFSEERMATGKHSNFAYDPAAEGSINNKYDNVTIHWNPEELDQKNRHFNELFETNFEKKIERDNSWFHHNGEGGKREDLPTIGTKDMGAPNQQNMNLYRNEQRKNNQMDVYRGFQEMRYNGAALFHEADAEEQERTGYVSSGDPFAKLKFDDIRKVYKDETIFSVDETQYENMPKYRTVKDYQDSRATTLTKPKTEQERNWEEHRANMEAQRQEKLAKDYQMEEMQRQRVNSAKNNGILGAFMRLGN